jgi:hypothetical protein
VAHSFDAARLKFRIEPREIVEFQSNKIGGAMQKLAELDDFRCAAVLSPERNLAV